MVAGASVTQGQVIAKFDDASVLALQAAVQQTQLALNTAQSSLTQAQTSDIAQAQANVITDLTTVRG